jgi:hypothetical protein
VLIGLGAPSLLSIILPRKMWIGVDKKYLIFIEKILIWGILIQGGCNPMLAIITG